jgi:hypothetical protein
MEYAAISLAILGAAIGLISRLKTLLFVVAALLVISLAFVLARGLGLMDSVLTILGAQAILQGSYFASSVAKAIFKVIFLSRPGS